MSREKVKEEKLGPKNGAEFTIRTWHEYLCDSDKELQHPISVDHEIPFNISTVLIERDLLAAGCWRRDSDSDPCFRFSDKVKENVMAVLEAALNATRSQDEISEASSPNQQLNNITPIKPKEHKKRLYEDEADTAFNLVDAFSCPVLTDFGQGVKMISSPADGKVILEGALLKKTSPLIETIFHFTPSSPSPGSLSPEQPQWISKWPLNLEERNFIVKVLTQRIPALIANEDQRVIIPEEAEPVPARFRPHTNSGKALQGPYISRQSKKPWNLGRQYFSTFNKNDKDGFLWADGTTGWADESKQRAVDNQKQKEKEEKQQGMLHLVGAFDLLDPAEMLEEEGSDEWDGEMCAGLPQIEVQVAASPPKRHRV